ncbi:DUF5685 family protein [Nocardia vinacea]|uniref:DUF5685 family protein n=1 Tax=Nocardia vinacea TaxID=96468 RepID=UPI00030086B5|nr:DUF5685 family protein [Nocardia vinacea]
MLRPCSHGAEKYGIDASTWRTHMCGLCLGLRDGHGQLARAATNTDAIVLSVLTEAQMSGSIGRTKAGPCALRGMRRAEVASADSPGVLLAATASLLLGSAKIRDHVDDGDGSVLTRHPMTKVSSRWADRARSQASLIGLDVEPLVAAINSQSHLEALASVGAECPGAGDSNRARSADAPALLDGLRDTPENSSRTISLDDLTAPTQICAAEFFAHTAVLADRPDNVAALREAGRHFGRIAHLADAVADFEDDRTRGRFNPLAATGTTMPEAYGLLRQSDSRLREAVAEAKLDQVPTIRWMLLDPLRGLVRNIGRGVGATAHACNISRDTVPTQQPLPLGAATMQHPRPPDIDFRKPPRHPGIGEALAIVFGVYCTGYACCADHTNPCNGKRKDAWIKNCDCGDCCDGCDCCSNCNCCDCDGCCCDGCGCDC